MKKIILIIALSFPSFIFCQTPIIDLLDDDGSAIPNAYYKDVNNLLDPFVGTYIYSDITTNTSFKVVLVKKTLQFNGRYYEDVIIGEYQYIENGVEKVSTIDELNQNYSNYNKYNIVGNILINNNNFRYWRCFDCISNEIRLMLTINDDLSQRFAYLILRRATDLAGQEIIKIKIVNISRSFSDNPNLSLDFVLPFTELTLIKQ
ncbi:hypothetical protein DI487_14905 [Flavobacterium sediminis]|uniref:DUF6705 domain-containing protein n=1 Tax=Flavobacterium sediminis TaxID=2201181 RepID=A0A2U8QYX0_9FLAO|nr:DUF6705 family protein [Flavobacterium sediminis]AWM15015.1 hypothetical protein DI487_14905 [Flavobacterium sediminis]